MHHHIPGTELPLLVSSGAEGWWVAAAVEQDMCGVEETGTLQGFPG